MTRTSSSTSAIPAALLANVFVKRLLLTEKSSATAHGEGSVSSLKILSVSTIRMTNTSPSYERHSRYGINE